jgi:hypothetical protein
MKPLLNFICAILFCGCIATASAQDEIIKSPRALFSYTYFILFEEPISTQKLDGYIRFYSSFGDKEYAYNVLINNMLNDHEVGKTVEMIYLKNISIPIPEARKQYSERLYAMMFNMIAWWSKKNNQMPTISMIQLFSKYENQLPQNLPENKLASMNNSCEFIKYNCGVYNSWAMNNPTALPKFIALHETFFEEWKGESSVEGTYLDFSQAMESWVKTNTPYEFVLPSQINTCNQLNSNGQLVFNEADLNQNMRLYITQIYRKLLNRSPRSTELNYLIIKIQDKQLGLKDLLFLLLTSPEYKEDFL